MRNKILMGVSLLALLGSTSQSMAQTATSGGLEDVVVTAQRIRQNLEDVPISVSSFDSAQLEQLQIKGTADISRLVPNMFGTNNVGTGSANVYYLRGMGQTESFPTFDPQVGTYVDDIYIGRQSANNFGLFDVDQLQVLRGPQGTLFGRNSTGGAVVVSLAKPTDAFGGYVEGGYGAYNRDFGEASVNLPASHEILTKTSVYGIRDDGYVDDVATATRLNAHNDYGVRESVRLVPASMDNVIWDLSADYIHSGFNAEQNSPANGKRVSYSGYGDVSAPVAVVGGASILADIQNIIKQPIGNLANGEDLRAWGAMSNLEIGLPGGKLNVITGYRGQNQIGAADFPFPAVSGSLVPYDNNELGQFGIALNSQVNQYSQELKWTGSLGDKVDYTAGVFYLYEENTSRYLETLTIPIAPLTVLGLELSSPEDFHNNTDSKAAYTQFDYKADEHLTVTLGARFTDENKTYRVHALGPNGFDSADVLAAGHPTSLTTDQLTPHLSLQYRFDPQLMVYGSATRGFQGGGWNSLTAAALTVTAFTPETVWTYETGARFESSDHRLRLNGDFFYNDIHNYQLVTLGPGQGNFVTENAADLITYGAEADLTYKPIDNLTLSGTLGLQNGYYTNPSATTQTQRTACLSGVSADCGQGIVSPDGGLAPPEYLPPVSATLAALYVWKFDHYDLLTSAGAQFQGRDHVDTSGVHDGLSGSHALLDLGATLKLNDQRISITAECQNCLNSNYEAAYLFVKYYNTPGLWDIKVRYDF